LITSGHGKFGDWTPGLKGGKDYFVICGFTSYYMPYVGYKTSGFGNKDNLGAVNYDIKYCDLRNWSNHVWSKLHDAKAYMDKFIYHSGRSWKQVEFKPETVECP
jgi:hypothetical protein